MEKIYIEYLSADRFTVFIILLISKSILAKPNIMIKIKVVDVSSNTLAKSMLSSSPIIHFGFIMKMIYIFFLKKTAIKRNL